MPKIVVLSEYCKGCMFCAEACPKDVIGNSGYSNTKGYQYAAALKPDDCIGCAICATVCPDAAIEVYK